MSTKDKQRLLDDLAELPDSGSAARVVRQMQAG
jgi:hypothetical protein